MQPASSSLFLCLFSSFHLVLGIQRRTRSCVGGSVGDDGCDDVNGAVMTQACNLNQCNAWSDWGDFGPCSATCGTGRYVSSCFDPATLIFRITLQQTL